MKNGCLKKMSVAVLAAMVGWAASAATYKVDLDRPGGLYRCGETATFTVRLLEKKNLDASRRPCAVLDNFGTTVFTNMLFDVSATGVVFKFSGTLREPGFLRLSLPPTKSGRNDPFVFSAGFEPEKIKKGSPSPADFDKFWSDARARLAREVPLDAQMTRVPERSTAAFDFYRISFATFGRRVHGYMSVPKDKAKAPFPVDFEVNAAGFGGWTNDMTGRGDAICVRFSVYPFAPDWKWRKIGLEAKYKEMDAALAARFGVSSYCQAGITESREDYFFYPVILGIDRAVDWVAARPDVDRSRFRYQGTSQGGGFGFYLCGLNHTFTRAAFYVPAITDTMGYLKGRQSGWPTIVEGNSSTPARRAAAEKWAPYFDGANFASRITCPVRVAVGFSDTTCPPCAVYAAYNEIKVKDKAIGNGIGMTHSCRGHFYTNFGKWVRALSSAAEDVDWISAELAKPVLGADAGWSSWRTVLSLPGERTVYDVMRDDLKAAVSARKGKVKPADVRRIAGIAEPGAVPLRRIEISEETRGDVRIVREAYVRPDGLKLPAIVFIPAKISGAPVIALNAVSRKNSAEAVAKYVAAGRPVMSIDLTGTGEIGLYGRKNGGSYYGRKGQDEELSVLLYALGQSLVGRQAGELQEVALDLKRRFGASPDIFTRGRMAVAAAHAFAVNKGLFGKVEFVTPPPSWSESVKKALDTPMSICVNGALLSYDWTELTPSKQGEIK